MGPNSLPTLFLSIHTPSAILHIIPVVFLTHCTFIADIWERPQDILFTDVKILFKAAKRQVKE